MANGLFGGGNGTTTAPYLVEDFEDLRMISKKLSSHYKQVNDIDASESISGWDGIGNTKTAFTGSYEGQGYKISNVTRKTDRGDGTDPSYYYIGGVFNYISAPCIIQNIELENIVIESSFNDTTPNPSNWRVGSLVGYLGKDSFIRNVTVNGGSINIVHTHSSYLSCFLGGISGYVDISSLGMASNRQNLNPILSCIVKNFDMSVGSKYPNVSLAPYMGGISAGTGNYNYGSYKDCHVINCTLSNVNKGATSYNGVDTVGIAPGYCIDCTVSDSSITGERVTAGICDSIAVRCHVSNTSIRSLGGIASGIVADDYYTNHISAEHCSLIDSTIRGRTNAAGITVHSSSAQTAIANCLVKNATITCDGDGEGNVGGMCVGYYVNMVDCACIDTTVISIKGNAGGLGCGGSSEGVINRCMFSGTVQGASTHVAGLLCATSLGSSSKVTNSFFLGEYIKGLGGKTVNFGRISALAHPKNADNYSLDTSQTILE